MYNLAQQIKKKRLLKNISQSELASLAQINHNTLVKLETGQITNPTINSLFSIAKALNTSIDSLVKESDTNNRAFGQVFTNSKVAKIMVQLAIKGVNKGNTVLDPCIGQNIFLNEFTKEMPEVMLTGIEMDKNLIDDEILSFYCQSKRNLIVGDFFDLNIYNKFDRIIMNPPYVRQEDLLGQINNKTRISNILKNLGIDIPSKSNLYVYFISKALKHLNTGGKLVAIIYDSWLYSDFGKDFRDIISLNHEVNKIIHFEQEAFDNVNVGATIMEITKPKSSTTVSRKTSYLNLKNPSQHNTGKNIKKINIHKFNSSNNSLFNFDTSFFIDLECTSAKPVIRGTSSIINKYFILEEKRLDNVVPIIKDIKRIRRMAITDNFKYLFSPRNELKEEEVKYINEIKSNVIKDKEKYRSVHKKIVEKKIWYKPRLIDPGNIIFNYYFRRNLDYLLNTNLVYTADNFYNLYINEKDLYLLFSILNSSLTKASLMESSKPQGHGLRKIQLNRFKSLKIINPKLLKPSTKLVLEKLGIKLSSSLRSESSKIINDIDKLLLVEYNSSANASISIDQVNSYLLNKYESKL